MRPIMVRFTVAASALLLLATGVGGATAENDRDSGLPPALVELRDQRTAYSKTFAGERGRRVTRLYASAIHSRDAEGDWQPISNAFVRVDGQTFAADGGSELRSEIPTQLSESPVEVAVGQHEVRLKLLGAEAEAVVDASHATYEDAFPGVTAAYHASSQALKEELTLQGPTSRRTFEFALNVSAGLTPRLVDNTLEMIDGSDRIVLRVPAPFMFERDDPGQRSHEVDLGLHAVENGWRLSVTPDDSWLDAAGRKWPVIVDPTLEKPAVVADCTIRKNQNTWQDCAGDLLTGDEYLSLIKFANLAKVIPSGNTIDAAVLVAHLKSVASVPRDVESAAVGRQWDPASVSWKKATSTTNWSDSGGTQYGQGGKWVLATDLKAAGPKEWDVTWIAQSWRDSGMSSYHGIWLKGPEAAGAQTGFASSEDLTRGPYLEISHTAITPAGNTVEEPTEGAVTGKRLSLLGRMTTKAITHVEWEYKAPNNRHWKTIPLTALRTKTNSELSSTQVSVQHGPETTSLTPDLTWDLTASSGVVDGPVQVRARYFVGASDTNPGVTKPTNVRLDRKDPAAGASAPLGPGSVNLLTGNFSMDRTDVSIESFKSDLTLSRTYSSRGENRRTAEMFGPGWESSVGADGPTMQYRGIYNFREWDSGEVCFEPEDPEDPVSYDALPPPDDPTWFDEPEAIADEYECWEEFYAVDYAVLEHIDGTKSKYRFDGTRFVADDAANTLSLTRVDPTHLAISDNAGNRTTFESAAADAPEYRPVEYREAAADNKTQLVYKPITETVDANAKTKLRLDRVIAPTVNGVQCPTTDGTETATDPKSCRRLKFVYHDGTSKPDAQNPRGPFPGRLVGVYFRAYDPTTASFKEDRVATYHYDPNGRLVKAFDPRLPRVSASNPEPPGEVYAYDEQGRLKSVQSEPDRPWEILYDTLPSSTDVGRVVGVKRDNLLGGTSTTSVVYNVPLSGTGAPHDMSASSVGRWGQGEGRPTTAPKAKVWNDVPVDATAIFPPNESTGDGVSQNPGSYARATIYYMNRKGLAVNGASPNGGISFTGYDQHGNVVRELSATNRADAVSAQPSGTAEQLSTIHEYDYSFDKAEQRGVERVRTLGPRHKVKLKGVAELQWARHETKTTFTAAPHDAAIRLPTTVEVGALRDDSTAAVEVRRTTYGYTENGTNRGWDLRDPSTVVQDAGGLNLTSTIRHHPTEPLVIERRTPAATEEEQANVMRYYYYGSELIAGVHDGIHKQECKGREYEYWYGMLCRKEPADSPNSHTPTHTFKYNQFLQPTQVTRHAGTGGSLHKSMTTTVYDGAGRVSEVQETGTLGAALPSVKTTYDPASGRATELSVAAPEGNRIVKQDFDALGRPWQYTDAAQTISQTTYDRLGRVATTHDGKRTQTRFYDATTGDLIRLEDLAIGAITATYDRDGRLQTEMLPNGLQSTTLYNATGAPQSLVYNKKTNCTVSCDWLKSEVKESIHGQWIEHDGTLSDQKYSYDNAGRLTRVEDTVGTQSCVSREYDYDKDSNRKLSVSIPANADGTCSADRARGQITTHTYSSSDRITDVGWVHDDLGRATTVPASAANGGELTSSYYVNDLVESLRQDGNTIQYDLDPLRRTHTRKTTTSSGTTTQTFRYDNGSDSPAWYSEGTNWFRFIDGIGGDVTAVEDSSGSKFLKLHNLHGDHIADASLSQTATGPVSTYETDEFGVPRQNYGRRLGYLGSKQRHTELSSGAIQMGVRTYLPSIGRFLATDPVEGGSANAYDYANADPVNQVDLDGRAPRLTKRQRNNANIIWTLARHAGLSRRRARELVGVALAESSLIETAENEDTGAAGLFQLLSPHYRRRAKRLGGLFDARANTCAILPDYVRYWKRHPRAKPGEAGRDIERSGQPASFYRPPRWLPRKFDFLSPINPCPR